jgi:hypothetical protein
MEIPAASTFYLLAGGSRFLPSILFGSITQNEFLQLLKL